MHTARLVKVSSLVGCALIASASASGCGGGGSNPPDSAPQEPDSAPAVIDAAAPDAEPAQPPDANVEPAPDAAPLVLQGFVLVGELDNLGPEAESTAVAIFQEAPLWGGPIASAGGCDIYTDLPEPGYSAGDIGVTGAAVPFTLVPQDQPPFVTYDPDVALPQDLFTDGATIGFAAAGADVPAFNADVTAPAAIAGASFPASELSRSNPPTITWTADAADEMWLWLLAFDETTGELRILWCTVAGDPGTFAFPSAATTMLPATADQGQVYLWRANRTTVTAGDSTVDVRATHTTVSPMLTIVP
jgi:hypothetical protein